MFATTRWSIVATAKDPAAPDVREALAELCRLYWHPVYPTSAAAGMTTPEPRT